MTILLYHSCTLAVGETQTHKRAQISRHRDAVFFFCFVFLPIYVKLLFWRLWSCLTNRASAYGANPEPIKGILSFYVVDLQNTALIVAFMR